MIDSNETLMYDSGRDAVYSEGYNDALKNVATFICEEACGDGGCPFKKDCDVYSDKACIERIVECFNERVGI